MADNIMVAQQYSPGPLGKIMRGNIDPGLSTFNLPKARREFEELREHMKNSLVLGVYRRVIAVPSSDMSPEEILAGRYDKEISRARPLEIDGDVNSRLVQVGYSHETLTRNEIKRALGEEDRVKVAPYWEISEDNPELKDYLLTFSYLFAKSINGEESPALTIGRIYLFNSALKVRRTNGLEKSINEPLKFYISNFLN